MRLQILAVGKMKAGPEQDLYARYADRIAKAGRSLHLDGPDLVEISESRQQGVDERKNEEASQLVSRLDAGATLIMLDEHGKDFSSQQFSELMRGERDGGAGTLAFALGGPDGHGEAIRQAARRSIRFGSMTWPHQIARIMLVEQLYRGITILSGHPYHRE